MCVVFHCSKVCGHPKKKNIYKTDRCHHYSTLLIKLSRYPWLTYIYAQLLIYLTKSGCHRLEHQGYGNTCSLYLLWADELKIVYFMFKFPKFKLCQGPVPFCSVDYPMVCLCEIWKEALKCWSTRIQEASGKSNTCSLQVPHFMQLVHGYITSIYTAPRTHKKI